MTNTTTIGEWPNLTPTYTGSTNWAAFARDMAALDADQPTTPEPGRATVLSGKDMEALMGTPEVQRVRRRHADSTVLGYIHGEHVAGRFHQSLMDLVLHDAATANRTVYGGGGLIELESGVNVATARNELVERFLRSSTAGWLWFLDADMTFPVDTLERLMEHADPDRAPIVGGLCFGASPEGEIFPTMYDLTGTDEAPQPVRYTDWPPDAMFQVFATGAACLLVHRRVFEAIRDYERIDGAGRGFSQGYRYFQETELPGGVRMSEDVTFCFRAGLCGFPVHVNTAVQIGHVKPRLITAESFRAQQAAAPTESGADGL